MASVEAKIVQNPAQKTQKVLLVAQLLLRTLAVFATLIATCVMARSDESIVLIGFHVEAKYTYTSAFLFFVIANAIACCFSVLSLIIVSVLGFTGTQPRNYFFLFLHDLIMLLLVMAACAAASAIGLVGRYGNAHTGWVAICNQFGNFCYRVIISIVFGYISFFFYLLLTVISAYQSRPV